MAALELLKKFTPKNKCLHLICLAEMIMLVLHVFLKVVINCYYCCIIWKRFKKLKRIDEKK